MSKRTPLTEEERQEKIRFKRLFEEHKGAWEAANREKLTQLRLGEIAGCELQGEPYSQGMVWQCLTADKDTKMPVKFVQFVASILGFDPGLVGPGFAIPKYLQLGAISESINSERIEINSPENTRLSVLSSHSLSGPPRLPVISSVAAGQWKEAVNPFEPGDADEWEILPGLSEDAFVLRVEGDSMTSHRGGVSIPNGAKVAVEPNAQPENGSIVVAKLDDAEAVTIKKLVLEPPYQFLMPLNEQYDRIFITENCRIVGVVKKVIQDL